MFLTPKMVDAINTQIANEFSNSLQYIAVANWFAGQDLKLIAGLYYEQAEEEKAHAMKFTEFLLDSEAVPVIGALRPVVNAFANAAEAAQLAYDAEVQTTKDIHALVALAQAENCPSASQMLQWFVQEQVEEIATAATNLNIVKKSGNNLFLMEAYLSHKK